MTKLEDHGLLKKRKMPLDKFNQEYSDKVLGSDKDVNFKPEMNQVYIYYFNVDIKFILKAKLYQLAEAHKSNLEASNSENMYKCVK